MKYVLLKSAMVVVVFLSFCGPWVYADEPQSVQVDAAFPGGNIVLDKIDGDDVYVHQDLRDTAGDWFYWHFRVRGGQGRTLTFHFTKGNPIGVLGPAVSTDGGEQWQWLGAEAVRGASFRFDFGATVTEARFCFAFPYQDRDLRQFLDRFRNNPHLQVESLCQTEKGRTAEVLRVGRLDGQCDARVAITCRHHCCEMMASYVLEGITEEILAESDDGQWLREHVEFFVVPMVDKDGVEDGDQGKNRKPRDHNRDYDDQSRYATVRAIRERLPAWSAGKLRFALDIHCPAIRGGVNEVIYLVGGPNQAVWNEVERFGKILETVQQGPLVYSARNNLPFGQGWNNQANYQSGTPFASWAAELPGVKAASTIEVPYANASGRPVTDTTARSFGHDLARALRKYLAEEDH